MPVPQVAIGTGALVTGYQRVYHEFRQEPITSKRLGGAATGTAGDVNELFSPGFAGSPGLGMEWHVKGTQTILTPVLTAVGLNIVQDDAAAADGIELTTGITARNPLAFTVGTDGGFYVAVRAKIADASGCNPFVIGFRKAEAYQATVAAYADYAYIGIIGTANPNTIFTTTELAGAGNVDTDTTQTWADAATKTLKVKVSSAGVVTYEIEGAAPTVVAAFSFAAAAVVVPSIFFLQAADLAGTIELISFDCGLQ